VRVDHAAALAKAVGKPLSRISRTTDMMARPRGVDVPAAGVGDFGDISMGVEAVESRGQPVLDEEVAQRILGPGGNLSYGPVATLNSPLSDSPFPPTT
jgi:hypothetical protein